MVLAEALLHPGGVALEDAGDVEGHHSEENACKEEEAREVNLVQRFRHAAVDRGLARLDLPLEGLGGCLPGAELGVLHGLLLRGILLGRRRGEVHGLRDEPDDAEGEEHAQVGRQARPHLQHGDQQDAEDAEDQHGHVGPRDLRACNAGLILIFAVHAGLLRHPPPCVTDRLPPEAGKRCHACHEGGQEETGNDPRGRDLVLDPQHRRRDVADGAPGAARVGGHDDKAPAELAEAVVVGGHVAQDLQGDNRGRQVVDDRAHEEAEQAEDGHEPVRLRSDDPVDHGGHDVEAPEVVDGLHHGHGRQQEEDDAADVLQTLTQVLVELLVALLGHGRVEGGGGEDPHRRGQDEHHGRLVDADHVLHRDEEQSD
mmetsp:Transcript_115580/g.359971  ORF Transcript_115580/g.359971 Transcript_115580/m.359971 type:complete len:370 (-) Transcript_115580:112-1221(-)